MSQPNGTDVPRRIDERENQQRDGYCDDRIVEVDQSPESGFVVHGPLSQVPLDHRCGR
jgi:hypothetical protein